MQLIGCDCIFHIFFNGEYQKLYFVFKSLYSMMTYSCANKQSQAEFRILALDETKYEARMEFSC